MTGDRINPNNMYDIHDMVRRESCVISGPIRLASYRVRDPETLEWSDLQFHMTYDNIVIAKMGENGARLFANFITKTLPKP